MSLLTGITNYWNFDGNSIDSVGGNNGTDFGVSYPAGKIGNGMLFFPTTTYSQLSNVVMTTSYTINFWYNPGAYVGDFFRAIFSVPGAGAGIYIEDFSGSTRIFFYEDNGGGYEYSITHLPRGVWSMLTLTVTGNVGSWYFNGIKDTLDFPAIDQTYSRLGFSHAGYAANGEIDELGIWNVGLSPSDIIDLYNGGAGLTYPFSGSGAAKGKFFFFSQ